MTDTRFALTHKFDIAGHEGYITVGLFEDGQPGELFIQMQKEGSTIGGLMDTVGALTSMALQYGVPLESLVKKFAFQRFEPSGFTKNPDIRNASSIIDYVFRWMGNQFIEGYREAHSPQGVQGELEMPGLLEELKKVVNRPVPDLAIAEDGDGSDLYVKGMTGTAGTAVKAATNGNGHGKSNGTGNGHGPSAGSKGAAAALLTSTFANQSDAPSCDRCGHITVRNGACYKCMNCGNSLGCS